MGRLAGPQRGALWHFGGGCSGRCSVAHALAPLLCPPRAAAAAPQALESYQTALTKNPDNGEVAAKVRTLGKHIRSEKQKGGK